MMPWVSGLAAGFPLALDRKSTRLNSSHLGISYAVFCLKKKLVATKIHSRFNMIGAQKGRLLRSQMRQPATFDGELIAARARWRGPRLRHHLTNERSPRGFFALQPEQMGATRNRPLQAFEKFRVGFFFFNDTPPPQIYTLSLHDALPI